MKKGMLLLLLMASAFAHGQSLKEALYSGKLKSQAGTVIRKGDDLSQFIDTTTKAPLSDSAKAAAQAREAEAKKLTAPMDMATINRNTTSAAAADNKAAGAKPATNAPAAIAAAPATDSAATSTTATTSEPVAAGTEATTPAAEPAKPEAPKDNNAIWKEFMTGIATALKTEALSSKKVKKDTYYASVAYTIELDGSVTVGDVSVSPENDYLQKQIKDRVTQEAPKLNPVLNSSGNPRKVTRRYNFALTKE